MPDNPKDLIGSKKVDLSLLPAVSIIHGAHALCDGAAKYGPYNWRGYPVLSRVYVAAALRHLLAWAEGEECAKDSGVHHLGHAIGCCAILLDAQQIGNLKDNRPHVNGSNMAADLLEKLNAKVAEQAGSSPSCPATKIPGRECDCGICRDENKSRLAVQESFESRTLCDCFMCRKDRGQK